MTIRKTISKLVGRIVNPYVAWQARRETQRKFDIALEGIDEDNRKWAEKMLTNHLNLMKMENASIARKCTCGANDNKKYLDDLLFNATGAICKNLIPLRELVGFQAMTGPVSEAHYLSVEDLGNNQRKISVLKVIASAMTRRLSSAWNFNMQTDMGADIGKEMIPIVGSEISYEIINETLSNLEHIANNTARLDLANYSQVNLKAQAIEVEIATMANTIGDLIHRGTANFIVVSPIVASMLMIGNNFSPADDVDNSNINLKHVGFLNDSIKVYASIRYGSEDKILVGYKGAGDLDTGFVYSPYQLLSTSGVVIDPNTFEPTMRFMTRYGQTTFAASGNVVTDSKNYYGVITLDNLMA